MISTQPWTIQPARSFQLGITLLFVLWLIGVGLPGCAASLDKRMAGYVGQHRNELVNNWGPPAEETKLKNGGTRIVYREELPLIHPSQYVDPSLRICEKVFLTDANGIIKSYSHDNCE